MLSRLVTIIATALLVLSPQLSNAQTNVGPETRKLIHNFLDKYDLYESGGVTVFLIRAPDKICPPCSVMNKRLQALEGVKGFEYLTIHTLDITKDADAKFMKILPVKRVPAIVIFKQGVPVITGRGVIPRSDLKEVIKEVLGTDSVKRYLPRGTPDA